MTDCTQASFIATEVTIYCSKKMTCCQREQGMKKTEAYNASANPLQIKGPGGVKPFTKIKAASQKAARGRMRADMEKAKTRADKVKVAKAHGANDCFAEEIADGASYEMDHPVDVKWGGEAALDHFVPLSPNVNNLFGQITRNIGNQMHGQSTLEITSVMFSCPGPCSPNPPPSQDYSTGKRDFQGPHQILFQSKVL